MRKLIVLMAMGLYLASAAQNKDTLSNLPVGTQLVALKYSAKGQWGYYLGQNYLYRQQFAEKYYINGAAKVIGVIAHLAGRYANPNNSVEFNVYGVGSNKLPQTRLSTTSVPYSSLDLSGEAYTVIFPNAASVKDSFFVSFNVDDYLHGGYEGDTLGLMCGVSGSRSDADLLRFGRNAVQAHNHSREDWKDFYTQNFSPIATHFALFPIIESNEITSILDSNEDQSLFTVYPNPSSAGIWIHCNASDAKVNVMDLNGRTIFSTLLGTEPQYISTQDWHKGTYAVKLESKDKTVTQKLVVQ